MRQHTHLIGKRLLSSALAILLAAACIVPAAAAEPIGDGVTPTYDEAYYATLDYYGNLLDGSVVYSIHLAFQGEERDTAQQLLEQWAEQF